MHSKSHPQHQDLAGFHPAFGRVAVPDGRRREEVFGACDRSLVALVERDDPTRVAIDPLGLSTILHLGFPLGVRTAIAGYERFPTGLVLGEDGLPRQVRRFQPPARVATTDELVEIVLEACRRHVPAEDPIAMLSGGRDSRMILLGLRAIGRNPRAVLTVGRPGFVPDATTAEKVCKALGLRLQPCDGSIYSGQREVHRHRAQSLESLEHGWLGVLVRRARRVAGPDPWITDGLGAGVLSTGSLMHEEAIALWKSGAIDELAEWVVDAANGVGPRFLEAVRRAGLPIASREEVLHELATVLRSLSNWPNPLGAFSLFHWSRRGIGASPFGLMSRPGRVFAPLCDDALVEALLAMDIDEAFAQDWREPVVARLWGSGSMPPYAEGAPRRRLAAQLRLGASSLTWWMFVRGLPEPLRRVASAVDADQSRVRQTFNRSAVAYLAALHALLDRRGRSGPAGPSALDGAAPESTHA